MNYEARLKELGLELPLPPAPGGSYVPAVQVGDLLYLAGMICIANGEMTHTGKVGEEHTIESARKAAEVCALNTLAAIKGALGSLDRVGRFVTVSGFVNGVSGFADAPAVINGASDLFLSVFGEAGRHARAAVTVAGLPRNSTVEVQAVITVRRDRESDDDQ